MEAWVAWQKDSSGVTKVSSSSGSTAAIHFCAAVVRCVVECFRCGSISRPKRSISVAMPCRCSADSVAM